MGKKQPLGVISIIVTAIIALTGGYLAGSYLGVNDVHDMITGLSLHESIELNAILAEIENAETDLLKNNKQFQADYERLVDEKKSAQSRRDEIVRELENDTRDKIQIISGSCAALSALGQWNGRQENQMKLTEETRRRMAEAMQAD